MGYLHAPIQQKADVEGEDEFWTGGFFAGCLQALCEREVLLAGSSLQHGQRTQLRKLARQWQESQRELAYPALDHDQGFRFLPTFGRAYELEGREDDKAVLLRSADSLVDRFNADLGLMKSWDECSSDVSGRCRMLTRHQLSLCSY